VNLTIAGSGAEGFSLGGSLAINLIHDTVQAYIANSTVTSTGDVTVQASDTSVNASLAGGIGISLGSGGGVGAALSYNLITNTIEAYVDGSTVTSTAGGL